MKNKEISRIIALALVTGVVINATPSTTKSVYAITQDVNNDSIENSTDKPSTDASELSGVSVEQMQSDFESVANSPSVLASEEELTSTKSTPDFSKFVYLSDLNYISSLSSTINGQTLRKDKSPNNGIITLQTSDDGTLTEFGKGMGAHAKSTLVYDISEYSSKFTELSTWVGIDNSQASNKDAKNADGVTFKIYVSNDLTSGEWIQVGDSVTVKQGYTAQKVTVDVANYRYLKLEANPNSSDYWDHAVYGDLRLIEDGYNVDNETAYTGFKTVEQYDAEISKFSVEENYIKNQQQVLEREFVSRIGYNNILTASMYVNGVSDALAWLQSDKDALQLFIEAGDYYAGNGYNALVSLGKLYKVHKDDVNIPTYKKMLLATAVAYSREVRNFLVDFGGSYITSDPVKRYEIMKDLYDDGRFVRQSEFENYPMELIRIVMGARLSDDEIVWLRNIIDIRFPDVNNGWRYDGYGYVWYNSGNLGNSDYYNTDNYEKWNTKYHLEGTSLELGKENGYGSKYSRMWMMMEAGGICWGITGFGNAVNNVQGIASLHTFQPGHEAEMIYNTVNGKGAWTLSNNISGWPNSYSKWGGMTSNEVRLPLQWGNMDFNVKNSGNNSSYIILAQDALNNYDCYLESMYYNLIANSYSDSERKEEAFTKSLEAYNKNVDATYGLIKLYSSDESTSQEKWLALGLKIAEDYKFFPAPMVDLMKLVSDKVADDGYNAQLNTMKTLSLQRATKATSTDTTQPNDCKAIANSLLGNNAIELANFSFSGENANTIKLNSFYDNSKLAIRISIDGGNTWLKFNEVDGLGDNIYTSQHSVKLTDEQVAQITAENDILVGLMGADMDSNYKIDIQAGKPLGSSIYKNDDENVLIGDVDNLEYSLDNGETWQDYVGGLDSNIRMEGDIVAKFRYKAHDLYVQGPVDQYTFHADDGNEESKYLQLRHVELNSYSSQQDDSGNSAANFIDGNKNTRWHTNYNSIDNDKYYSVKFDKVRYISKLTYLPDDPNGRLRSGDIYTSMDGENWDKVYSFKDISNDYNLKELDLGKSIEAKYLKLVATETYGNHDWEYNRFVSGKMLNFYEDTTKVYNPEEDVRIDYSTTDTTNGNVTATLVLPEGCNVAEGESLEHEFTDNGDFVFTYTDANSVLHSITAIVSNIEQ